MPLPVLWWGQRTHLHHVPLLRRRRRSTRVYRTRLLRPLSLLIAVYMFRASPLFFTKLTYLTCPVFTLAYLKFHCLNLPFRTFPILFHTLSQHTLYISLTCLILLSFLCVCLTLNYLISLSRPYVTIIIPHFIIPYLSFSFLTLSCLTIPYLLPFTSPCTSPEFIPYLT